MSSQLRTLFLFMAGIVCLALQPADARADKRVALIVGNAKYENARLTLRNPSNDAEDIAGALKSLDYDVILLRDSRKGEFESALAEFSRKAEGADVALIYYAGHGVQYQQNNYLLPTDIPVKDIRDVQFRAVKTNDVMQALQDVRGVKLLILDACRDNPFAGSKLAMRSTGGASRGLGRIDATLNNMVVVFATGPDDKAQDGSGRNSPFAEALISRLKEPGVEINELFREVASDVYKKTQNTDQPQHPEIHANLFDKFFLNPNEGDRMVWNRIRESQDPGDFKKFIERFPNSPYARDAQIRIDLFERLAALEQRRKEAELEEQKLAREAKAREVARRLEAEKTAAEQRAREEARRREEEARIAAQKAEERRIEEKRQQEAAAERARLAAETARKAIEDAKRQREEEARIAAKTEEERRRKEDEARIAAEQMKAAKEAERRAKEEAERLAAAKCAGEDADLKRLSDANDISGLETFRAQASCAGMNKAAERELRRIKVALARACDKDRRAYKSASRKGLTEIKAAFQDFTCEAVRTEAQAQIASLEANARAAEASCVADRQAFNALDLGAMDIQQKLTAFRNQVKCTAVKADIDRETEKSDGRAKELQAALAHAGCYDGRVNGEIDESTRSAVKQFLSRKGMNSAEGRLTDDFVSTVKSQ
ncbi:MAG: caspase family protein, partial [Methylocystis sp.]